MRLIKCPRCGNEIHAEKAVCYCDNCRAEVKRETLYRERSCKSCGTAYMGYPSSLYCPDCQSERNKAAAREYAARRRMGKTRKIGSTQICEYCGGEYELTAGRQRYCPQCAEIATKENIKRHKQEQWQNDPQKNTRRNERRSKLKQNRRVCPVCHNTFYSGQADSTCSEDCRKIWASMNYAKSLIRTGKRTTPYGVVKNNGNPKSGVVGVTYCRGKWQATRKGKYLGVFETVAEAANAIELFDKNSAAKENIKK